MSELEGKDMQEHRRGGCRWWPTLVISLVFGGGLCVVGVFVLIRPLTPRVTPGMEQTARQALLNPDKAPIDLSSRSSPEYYPPNGNDYAVEAEMVIFPQPESVLATLLYVNPGIGLDLVMPALVYSPDGLIPSTRNGHPCDSSAGGCLHGLDEWFLYDCQQVDDHPLWWKCTLLDGNSMW